jgi:hypothetical protein
MVKENFQYAVARAHLQNSVDYFSSLGWSSYGIVQRSPGYLLGDVAT